MSQKIIVSLTSYGDRLKSLPVVLNSMLTQSVMPDKIVLNLHKEEILPEGLVQYLFNHPDIQVNRVPYDTKVWKKFLPTFEIYPDDMIICIDDDFIYPYNMIDEMVNTYLANPEQPVSGNRVEWYGLACHCGCASLVTRKFFDGIDITPEMMAHCKSSDFAYTWLLAREGIYYQRTPSVFFKNMKAISHRESWTNASNRKTNVPDTLAWLEDNFGQAAVARKAQAAQPVKGIKVYYDVPWSSEKNIGKAYNEFAALVPEGGWICFMDADTIPTTADYGAIIEGIIRNNPQVLAFTCVTNRIGCPWQIAEGSDWENDNMAYHRKFGAEQYKKFGTAVEDVTDKKHVMSGQFMCFHKSLWDAIGGAPEDLGMLGVDNALHRRIKKAGYRLYLAKGLYVYHWYRGGNKSDKSHLL